MANLSILDGRLTADPELRQTPAGVAVTSFTIAVDRAYTPKGGEKQTDFIDIVAWRQAAEFVCRYFTKGKWIQVIGSIQTRKYVDKNGNNRKAFEVVADHVNFVGDKQKEDGVPASNSAAYAPPPPTAPAGFDPFAGAPGAAPPPPDGFPTGNRQPAYVPAYAGYGGSDFADVDDDGDLPF